ncbi:SLC13 family permease [soil metagenome]
MNLFDMATDPRALTLAVALVTLGLFVWNRLRLDVVALIAMTSLMLLGVVTPAQGISGFANEAVITVAAMLALSAGLLRTGAVDDLGRWIQRASGKSEFRLLLILIAVVIPVSALINNTAAVAVLLPVVVGVARSMDVAPSRVLMPLSFAGQMGGTLTLVGTSTNLLVAGLVLDLGMDRIGLFDITPPAAILALAGAAYLLTVGRWLTPVRESPGDLVDAYDLREYLASFRVLESSRLAGSTLADSRLGEREGILVVGIRREGRDIRGIGGATTIEAGDELLVEGSVSDMARFTEEEGLEVATEEPAWDFPPDNPRFPGGVWVPRRPPGPGNEAPGPGDRSEAEAPPGPPEEEETDEKEGRILAELLVQPRAFADQQPLGRLALHSRWGITVLGLQRRGRTLRRALRNTPLKAGDLLLVEGTADQLHAIHKGGDFSLLGSVEVPARRRHLKWFAVGILLAVVALPAVGVLPIVVTATAGVVAMFLTGCLTPQEAYVEMDWMVLVLLGAILPLGIAMQETGTAELLVGLALSPVGDVNPLFVLAAFYLMTSLLTEAISNNAAAVVMTPLAVASAATLGFSPLPLVIAVMFAASNSFLTPIGYQTNTFIHGPGGYRFLDFVRVGGPLGLLLLALSTVVIPIFFPF